MFCKRLLKDLLKAILNLRKTRCFGGENDEVKLSDIDSLAYDVERYSFFFLLRFRDF